MGFLDFFGIQREELKEGPTKKDVRVSSGAYMNNVVRVNGDTALKVAAVYRAVYLISSSAACLTLQYKRKDRAKGYFKLYDNGTGRNVNYVLSVRPNERMNAFTFLKSMISQVLLKGNAVIIPERDSLGNISRMVLTTPGSVDYDKDRNVYRVMDDVNKINKVYTADEVIHIKNTCTDGGYWGVSTVQYAATTLGIAATADRETLKRFGTGGRFKAILQNDKTQRGFGNYDDGEMSSMADDIQDALNSGDDIIQVKGDGSLTPISMSSADMQFLESRKFTIREIARFFNVPPSKLMDDSNSNYKSTEMSNIQFYVEALQPIITEIEREFNAKLLTATTFMDYKYIFDLSSLYALDLESKAKWNKARLETGQASVNDLRREEDKEPVDKGDEIYLSVNYAPLGSEKLSGKTGGGAVEGGGAAVEG